MASAQSQEDQVLEEETSFVRILTLNRPRQLNALSAQMGKGRAFCAGGDVAAVVRGINEGDWISGAKFFSKEFILNYLMATYTKPQVSILNGIVMGGGAGVSIHGRFRVATENSVFAMPETALGLFPDIGASYFLSRLPGFFGEYVGLTGARLDGAEMRACGLATHFVPSSESESTNRADAWISDAIQSLKKASPTSLKISLRSIREGRLQGVGQCLIREYRMVCHVMMGEVSKDFFEVCNPFKCAHGCRAILLDKDKNPKWKPSKLELVNDNMVDQYFSKINDDRWEDIKLPARSNLPATAIAKL
ncbi:3-hydroxyisobutyryl-CoA hydrolase 1 [Citrus sinensis]|nr:3-hydroxyisobutyryl-CoA hydrolase 1 [Citrus sinensis]